METKKGKIFYAEKNKTLFLKLKGEIHYTISSGFDALVTQVIIKRKVKDVIIDLKDANSIDSTNLGIIAKIARYLHNEYQKKAVILSPNSDIGIILESFGFDSVFIIVHQNDGHGYDMNELEEIKKDGKAPDVNLLLEAHTELSRMNEKNETVFKDVIKMFQQEL